MKKCPYCAEFIQNEAVKCPYCLEFIRGGRYSPGAIFWGRDRIKTGAFFLVLLFLVAGVFFLRARKYPGQKVPGEGDIAMAARTLPEPANTPPPTSKIDAYLKAYPAYYGLTTGNETAFGKYWYQNYRIFPRKTFYFDTLEQLDEQKLKYNTEKTAAR